MAWLTHLNTPNVLHGALLYAVARARSPSKTRSVVPPPDTVLFTTLQAYEINKFAWAGSLPKEAVTSPLHTSSSSKSRNSSSSTQGAPFFLCKPSRYALML